MSDKVDNTERDKKLMEKLRRARIDLLSNHPFFGDLALSMPMVIDDTLPMPTAATDGESLFFHPDFVAGLTEPQTTFVMGHEVIHAAFMHIDRIGGRNPHKFNLAADIVTNQILVDNQIGAMPQGLVYDPYLYAEGGGIVTRIYDLLPDNDQRQAMDDLMPIKAKGIGQAMKARARIQRAFKTAKDAGKMPGNLEKLIEMFEDAKVSWEDELFQTITSLKGDDRTYAKRNRRFPHSTTLMPGRYGEQMGDLVFAIDCSGSTSDAMVSQCAAEIKKAMQATRPERTIVIYWDTTVKKVETYGPDDELNVKVYGRGGTDPNCIWKYIEENDIHPEHCVVATDLYFGGNFGPEPDYPVIWCVMDSNETNAPFGKVINTGMVNGYDEDNW